MPSKSSLPNFPPNMQNAEIEGIDMGDYPDFCDAYITYAEHQNGTPYTDAELEKLNEDSALVYETVWDSLF